MNIKYVKQHLNKVLTVDYVVTINYFEFTRDLKHGGELHPFWEFVYIDKGEIEVTAGNKMFLLKKDEIIFHKPDEFHKIVFIGTVVPNVIIISFDTKSRIMKFFNNKIMHLTDDNKQLLAQLLSFGMSAFTGPFDIPFRSKLYKDKKAQAGCEQKFKNLLELFLIDLINQNVSTAKSKRLLNPASKSGAYGAINEITRFLEDNISKAITLDELSIIFKISKSTLKQVFRAYTGKPLIHYHTHLKIAEAKRLLREGKYSVTTISQMLGFNTIHYFSRCFKKYTGMSPTSYISTLKARLESNLYED